MEFALPGSTYQYGPDKTVAVEHIDLHLEPNLMAASLRGICTTTVRALDESVARLTLNAVDHQVESVTRDGKPCAFAMRNGKLTIEFTPAIAAGESASFAVAYQVTKPRAGLFFIAPSKEYPNKIPHAWTQSQDEI